jgi:hypothetical protein
MEVISRKPHLLRIGLDNLWQCATPSELRRINPKYITWRTNYAILHVICTEKNLRAIEKNPDGVLLMTYRNTQPCIIGVCHGYWPMSSSRYARCANRVNGVVIGDTYTYFHNKQLICDIDESSEYVSDDGSDEDDEDESSG